MHNPYKHTAYNIMHSWHCSGLPHYAFILVDSLAIQINDIYKSIDVDNFTVVFKSVWRPTTRLTVSQFCYKFRRLVLWNFYRWISFKKNWAIINWALTYKYICFCHKQNSTIFLKFAWLCKKTCRNIWKVLSAISSAMVSANSNCFMCNHKGDFQNLITFGLRI